MTTPKRSIFDVLAVLSAGATLLVGCADAPPPPVASPATEVSPAAMPAVPPVVTAAPPPVLPAAAPAAVPAPAAPIMAPAAKAKVMPPKIPNSKRTADKSAAGCCGAGTCAPC